MKKKCSFGRDTSDGIGNLFDYLLTSASATGTDDCRHFAYFSCVWWHYSKLKVSQLNVCMRIILTIAATAFGVLCMLCTD